MSERIYFNSACKILNYSVLYACFLHLLAHFKKDQGFCLILCKRFSSFTLFLESVLSFLMQLLNSWSMTEASLTSVTVTSSFSFSPYFLASVQKVDAKSIFHSFHSEHITPPGEPFPGFPLTVTSNLNYSSSHSVICNSTNLPYISDLIASHIPFS